ncbi:cyclic nucleotide-binding domain-containing protein [Anaerosporobacter faecicola]|uniref:hypothetical protein n=1 Tax=Anaerosporobacter faecicola TaxID=2718714 RepID=UPI00143A40DE|nr:hypothetical protein [Anaerosporobacter faecicola]
MGAILNPHTVNQLVKGTEIYGEHEALSTICLVLKGRVLIQNDGSRTVVGSGSFIGITDLYAGRMISNYIAYEDVVLYPFEVKDSSRIKDILATNKDYAGLLIAGVSRSLVDMQKTYVEFDLAVQHLYKFLNNAYNEFKVLSTKVGYRVSPIDSLETLEPFPAEVLRNHANIEYYKTLSKVPIDIQKAFFSCGEELTKHHVNEIAKDYILYMTEATERAVYISQLLEYMISESSESLFYQAINVAIDVHKFGRKNDNLDAMVDQLIEEINKAEKLLSTKTGRVVSINREKMEKLYSILLTGTAAEIEKNEEKEEHEQVDQTMVLNELHDSMKKILDYSGISVEEAMDMKKYVIAFRNLSDKFDSSDEARSIRRGISKMFYPIYQAVFLRAYQEKNTDKVIDLFLRYGFLDETLLSKEQLVELYSLGNQVEESIPCKVYNIRDWLIEIYEGRREPSKSEFDLDYIESVREMKKSVHMSQAEEKALLADQSKKLNYEIINMFQCNNRLVNGQVSFFVPILHQELFIKSLRDTFVTAAKVNYEINQLRDIDYSVFYRETLYYDHEKNIEKEYIQKEVFPEIILLPTAGINGVMWQEITGKKRDTSGRFLLPCFAEVDIQDMLVKVLGRFHWELCRSIQGTAWNNIKYKSLTSEYVDYIQFYRKNRDLSPETKERIKLQIQKGKNNSREIFVIDYVNWIKNESKGAIRLNKYVRELLAMYCPFNKKIRDRLMAQPLFAEAMNRFNREHAKKIHEIELRYKALEKEKIDLTEELIATRDFYNEQ